jgi:hypothetical protein
MAKKKRKYSGVAAEPKRNSARNANITALALILLLLSVAVGSVFLFQRKLKSNQEVSQTDSLEPTPYLSTLESMKNAENIDIKINKDDIEPDRITLNKDKDYNFRIIKFPGSTCQSLKNNSLDYSLQLLNTATSYPIRIPTAGNYELICEGQDAKISIKVE